jgi:hypothetical protein
MPAHNESASQSNGQGPQQAKSPLAAHNAHDRNRYENRRDRRSPHIDRLRTIRTDRSRHGRMRVAQRWPADLKQRSCRLRLLTGRS